MLDCEFNLSVGQNTVTVPLASSKAKRFFDAKVATQLLTDYRRAHFSLCGGRILIYRSCHLKLLNLLDEVF